MLLRFNRFDMLLYRLFHVRLNWVMWGNRSFLLSVTVRIERYV